MANRYWVGGTSTWDSTAGTKWALTSGGAGGQAVPTSGDDVFFDAASGAVTCTVSGSRVAKTINCTGFTGTLAGSGALTLYGNLTIVAGMVWSHTGSITFSSSATITSAGKTLGATRIELNQPGSTVQLADALTLSGNGFIQVTAGTFTTNNFNVTASYLTATGTQVRQVNLGSSTLTFSSNSQAVSLTNVTNLTFNAGTSQINVTANNAKFETSPTVNTTFYNVTYTSTAATINASTTRTLVGLNTFNNLTVTGPSTTGIATITFANSQTINGTLATTGTTAVRRVFFSSNFFSRQRTLTINTAPSSLIDADFRDIIVNGTAAPISGTRLGNRAYCLGINFDAPKNVYWNKSAGGSTADTDAWALTAGGAVDVNNFPLPQDTIIITATNPNNGTSINISSSIPYIGTLDMSARLQNISFTASGTFEVYGDVKYSTLQQLGGGGTMVFAGGKTQTLTSNGRVTALSITVNSPGGTLQLADAFSTTVAGYNFILTAGTLDTNNFTFSYSNTNSSFTCSGSEITGVKFGSSTVTFGSMNVSNVNLNFDAGTSQINLISVGSGVVFLSSGSSGSKNFYNVSITPTSSNVTRTINGSNTFNNLFLQRPNQGYAEYAILGNQTVNGTLSSGGAILRDGCSRILIRSDTTTLGNTRTLTCNAIDLTDTDFRDIRIAGNATGTSPTRAGDCGGNSGITFPAPKTVYKVNGALDNWNSADCWALTSGGTGANINFPLPQDTAIINNDSGGTRIIFNQTYSVGSIDCSARTTSFELNHTIMSTRIYGNYTLSSAITLAGSPSYPQYFQTYGTQTITSAGRTITFPIQISGLGKVQLGDSLTTSSTIIAASYGEFDPGAYNVTCDKFDGSYTTAGAIRTIRMGSGLWTLTGTGSVWTISDTGLNFFKDTANILLSNTTSSSRTFTGGGLSYNKLTIGGNTGTSTLTITGNNQFTELASTKTVAHTIALGTTTQTFGAWTVTGTAGNVVTITGSSASHFLAGPATENIDYLVMGSVGFAATSNGEFYAGPNSTGSAGGVTFRTARPTPRTLYWVGGTGNWSDTARWSLTSGGAGGQSIPRSLDTVIFNSASNATAYTSTINADSRCDRLLIAGPASGNVTLAGTSQLSVHSELTLPATGLTRSYTGSIYLSGSGNGKTLTTNGVALSNTLVVNGVGSIWSLGSALNIGNSTLVVVYGSFSCGTYALTAARIQSNYKSSRSINLGSSTVNLTGTTSITFGTSESERASLTFNAGTSEINISTTIPNITANNQTFYNVSLTSTSISTATIVGVNTFNNFSVAGGTGASLKELVFNNDQTINGTLTLSAGVDAVRRHFVRSDIIGTTRTLTCNAVSATDADFRDITIAGTAAPVSGIRLGDCGGNSGITFDAAKTVYWNLAGTQNWTATAWATSSGGTPDVNNFPLAQDTAVFDNNGAAGTVTIQTFNISAIDASTRTSAMTLAYNAPATSYGNYTLGSGVTISGPNPQTFSGRGTQTFTSAGKFISFSTTIAAPNGTFRLGDSTTFGLDLILYQGTLDANNYNVTANQFISQSSTIPRTLIMGSGLWTLQSTSPWTVTSPNLTFNKGTANILLNSSGTTARTFAGGGLSYNKLISGGVGISTLTISGNNSFTEIASTRTTAHTIMINSTTQRVGAWTAKGSAGNILTIDTSTGSGNFIYTGSGSIEGLDYLSVAGNAYGPDGEFLTGIWNAGSNSVNSSSKGAGGWTFNETAVAPPTSSNFFLMFG